MDYNNLSLFSRPKPFQMGTLTLWSNEYIANSVLKKHIDDSIDSGSRKLATIERSSEWIVKKSSHNPDILDIGCGPGLYGNKFSTMVNSYDGIDISPYQISYAKKHNESKTNVTYYVCDFRKWNVEKTGKKYDSVLLMYAVYSFYNFDERINLLREIRKSLKQNGIVIIEVFTSKHYEHRSDITDWRYVDKNGFWLPDPYIELNSFMKYSDDLILIQAGIIEKRIYIWNSWIQLFDVSSLKYELSLAGFTKYQWYGSCCGDHFSSDSEVLCACAGF